MEVRASARKPVVVPPKEETCKKRPSLRASGHARGRLIRHTVSYRLIRFIRYRRYRVTRSRIRHIVQTHAHTV